MANPQLLEYVKQQIAAGAVAGDVEKKLLEVGWPQSEIGSVFGELNIAIAGVPVVPMTAPAVSQSPAGAKMMSTTVGDGALASAYDLGIPNKNVQIPVGGNVQVSSPVMETKPVLTQPAATAAAEVPSAAVSPTMVPPETMTAAVTATAPEAAATTVVSEPVSVAPLTVNTPAESVQPVMQQPVVTYPETPREPEVSAPVQTPMASIPTAAVSPGWTAPVIPPTTVTTPTVVAHSSTNHGVNPAVWVLVALVVVGAVGGGAYLALANTESKTPVKPVVTTVPPTPTTEPEKVEVATPPADASSGASLTGEVSVLADAMDPTPFVSQKGFKILYPKAWRSDESGSFGTLVSFSNPMVDTDKENKFAANINVVSEDAKSVTLEDYLAASKEVLAKTFSNYSSVSERKTEVKGVQGFLLEAKYEMGVYKLHNMQLILIKNNKAYVVTATALDTTWATYKQVMEASLLSFELQ